MSYSICSLCFFLILSFMHPCIAAEIQSSTHPKVLAKDLGMTLLPHRALYDIKLHKVSKEMDLLNIKGEMYFSLESSCSGWITDHQFTLFYNYKDLPHSKITSSFSTYESYDGKSFQFTTIRKINDGLSQEFQGSALRKTLPDTENTEIKVEYLKPIQEQFSLMPNTLFPMQHTAQILKAAMQGQTYVSFPLFDGSSEKRSGESVDVTAFITPIKDSPFRIKVDEPLYKIDLAFFSQNSKSELAEYEIILYLHKSGIVTHMLIDYGSFSVSQNLRSVEDLPQTKCGAIM